MAFFDDEANTLEFEELYTFTGSLTTYRMTGGASDFIFQGRDLHADRAEARLDRGVDEGRRQRVNDRDARVRGDSPGVRLPP
jgi:hypothetical protein